MGVQMVILGCVEGWGVGVGVCGWGDGGRDTLFGLVAGGYGGGGGGGGWLEVAGLEV